jgi:archaellum biogenesis protein FlaJ (TadC family)
MSEALISLLQDYLLKVGFLILNGAYIIFLIVVFQQSKAMKRVIDAGPVSNLLIYIALANILIGILIFVAALVIL